MIGRTIGSYRILEKLGGGGMGVVYKARDEKLDRTVALKFLPPHLAESDSRKQRFVREARAASALDHANVCTIYDVGEADDGQLYIAMGYCAGDPLDERIARGPLSIDSAVAIALQVARGLRSAHAAGIIHRDIKPANIIVTDDDAVKIVDFGLAKLTSETALTQEGTTVGTVAYMSPEQARGQDVDHRTDIWSLGAVLYEMVTGRRAFGAEHDAAQLYLIANEEPAAVPAVRARVPAALAALIHRMLEKDADRRPQTAEDVVGALEAGDSGFSATTHGDVLAEARDALEREDHRRAFDLLRAVDSAEGLSADGLDMLGKAAFWLYSTEDVAGAWERCHTAYVKAGRDTDAARVAVRLANEAHTAGHRSVYNGWIKRAEALLKDHPDAVENGYLARQKAQAAIEADVDPEAALEMVEATARYAEQHDDADLRAYALQDRGRVLLLMDRVDEGLALIEEAMSMAMSGELSPGTVGSTYCNMISACDRISDYRRAGEWSDNALRWSEPHTESCYPGICQVHRADVMRVRGAWSDAESEAERAIANCEKRLPPVVGEAFYLKGEIMVRRGQYDQAAACFQEAHQRGRQPLPGLAMLRLAQGNVEAARSLVDRALAQDMIGLERVKFLPAGVEIALAAGDVALARQRADELELLAGRYKSSVFMGHAALASGAVALAQGDAEGALAHLTSAYDHFKASDMPYDEARTHATMADAYRSAGDKDLALLEAGTAHTLFDRLGALPDIERLGLRAPGAGM